MPNTREGRPRPPSGNPPSNRGRPVSSAKQEEDSRKSREVSKRSPLVNRLRRQSGEEAGDRKQEEAARQQPTVGTVQAESETDATATSDDEISEASDAESVRRRSEALGAVDGALLMVLWSARAVRGWGEADIARISRWLAKAGMRTCPQLEKAIKNGTLNERVKPVCGKTFNAATIASFESALSLSTKTGRSAAVASASQQQVPSVRGMRRKPRRKNGRQLHDSGGSGLMELMALSGSDSENVRARASTPVFADRSDDDFEDRRRGGLIVAPDASMSLAVSSSSRRRRCSSAPDLGLLAASARGGMSSRSGHDEENKSASMSPQPAAGEEANVTPGKAGTSALADLVTAPSTMAGKTALPTSAAPASPEAAAMGASSSRGRPPVPPSPVALANSGQQLLEDSHGESFRWTSLAMPHGSASDYRIVEVPLNHLYFYQSAIAGSFSDGRSIQSTVDGLRNGTITPRDMPLAHAMLCGKRLYCMGTRRLTCFNFAWKKMDPTHKVTVLWNGSNNRDAMPQGNDIDMTVFGGLRIDNRFVTRVSRGPAEEEVDVRDLRRQWMTGLAPVLKSVQNMGVPQEEYFYPCDEVDELVDRVSKRT
eukprot:Hpha_TRINITY_DN12951_c0_g1::TRINITY_DN12951_c0_g1_i1::g.164494::m.164494